MKKRLVKREDGGEQPPKKKVQTLAPATVNANATVVNDPNDKRLQQYKDSLAMYNYGVRDKAAIIQGRDNPGGSKFYTNWNRNNPYPQGARDRLEDHNNERYWGTVEPGGYQPLTDKAERQITDSLIVDYPKPTQPVIFRQPDLQRTNVQGPTQVPTMVPQIGAPTGGVGPLAGGPTNFSFTGRDDQGQQTTRYFPDLSSWQNATDAMGYRDRSTTNNGQQANATGYQFKDGGMKKLTKADLGLAQIGQGPQPIQAPGFNVVPPQQVMGTNNATPIQDPNNPNQGGDINWNHVLNSYVAQNLTSAAVSNFSPNSQQNTIQRFNKQQFNPLNFLPYTSNNSTQAKFGTQQMADGGLVDEESMRKWILDNDNQVDAPSVQQEVQQAPQQSPEYSDALQFANFVQMFGLDQADGEQQPEADGENQYMYKDGGIHIKKSHKGKFTAYKKRTGKTTEEALHSKDPHVRKMAQFAKNAKGWHHKAMGGGIPYSEGQELDISPEEYAQMIQQGYQFE